MPQSAFAPNHRSPQSPTGADPVLTWKQADPALLKSMLARFPLEVCECLDQAPIPGSYFGESEAGLIGNRLYLRADTPLHSALHEACHFICMDEARRAALHTDAGGDYAEEDAVCYLQILIGGLIPGCGQARMFADMDAWGYTFRLGSARAWFEQDAQDARGWLRRHGLTDAADGPTWSLRV